MTRVNQSVFSEVGEFFPKHYHLSMRLSFAQKDIMTLIF